MKKEAGGIRCPRQWLRKSLRSKWKKLFERKHRNLKWKRLIETRLWMREWLKCCNYIETLSNCPNATHVIWYLINYIVLILILILINKPYHIKFCHSFPDSKEIKMKLITHYNWCDDCLYFNHEDDPDQLFQIFLKIWIDFSLILAVKCRFVNNLGQQTHPPLTSL